MSRCFPFPPPGYEKKTRIDDTDLLKKEKHKEKKHKKDKKEKEKKEGKEKRDKDRSKEKHREKKERKEKSKDKERDRHKEKNSSSDEKKVEAQPEYSNGGKLGSNGPQNGEIKSIYVEELAKRIRDDNSASGSQTAQTVGVDQRSPEVEAMAVDRRIDSQYQEKDSVKNKIELHRKVNGQRNHINTKILEKACSQSSVGMDQERVEGIVRSGEKKDTEKQMEEREKNKQKECNGKGDKNKGRDREKNRKPEDKDRDKEEKKKTKEIIELSKEQPKLKENASKLKECSKDPLDFRNLKSPEPLKLSNMSPAAEGNLGKRKEHERNGFLLDNGNRPNKFSRPGSSSHPVVKNGMKLEPCQNFVWSSPEKQILTNNHKVDIKEQKIGDLVTAEHKVNGLIAAQPVISSTNSSSVSLPVGNGETFAKPPHPDTKYLGTILRIPEMQELPVVDDQDWLFSRNQLQPNKPSMKSPGIDGRPQVWAEALQIEYADIFALPYVIPY